MSVLDLQALLGLVLYFLFSPYTQRIFANFAAAMQDTNTSFYGVEHLLGMLVAMGLGAGFIPANYDASIVDDFVRVSNENAFATAKALARQEGILAGFLSGVIAGGNNLRLGLTGLGHLPDEPGPQFVRDLPVIGATDQIHVFMRVGVKVVEHVFDVAVGAVDRAHAHVVATRLGDGG